MAIMWTKPTQENVHVYAQKHTQNRGGVGWGGVRCGAQMLFWGSSQIQNNPQLKNEILFCCCELIIFPGVWHLTLVITILLLSISRCLLVVLANKHHQFVLLSHRRSHLVVPANKHHCTIRLLSYPIVNATWLYQLISTTAPLYCPLTS